MTPSTLGLCARSAALVAGILVCLAGAVPAVAQTADVDLPAAVSFSVFDVSASSTGSPNPTRLQFTSIDIDASQVLRVNVQADAAAFTPPAPGGSTIPASRVSWTTSGAQGGSGTSGTLSDTAYGQVFESATSVTSAQVDVHWTLGAIGGGVRAGFHDLTLRWKIESVAP